MIPDSPSERNGLVRRFTPRRLAALGALVLFGGLITVTQVSAAHDNVRQPQSQEEDESQEQPQDNGVDRDALGLLSATCEDTQLPLHSGFPDSGPACVATDMGSVGAADQNPQLLITSAPESVQVGEQFTLMVSTRNLVRDRFVPAAEGGFYAERGRLNEEGLIRGHFHTACRMLTSTVAAPEPEPEPAFFVATEDNGGGDEPDQVAVVVDGLTQAGLAQCAVWAGDGSHRMPMMARADQIPAFDVVRIAVFAGDGDAEGSGEGDGSEGDAEGSGEGDGSEGDAEGDGDGGYAEGDGGGEGS